MTFVILALRGLRRSLSMRPLAVSKQSTQLKQTEIQMDPGLIAAAFIIVIILLVFAGGIFGAGTALVLTGSSITKGALFIAGALLLFFLLL